MGRTDSSSKPGSHSPQAQEARRTTESRTHGSSDENKSAVAMNPQVKQLQGGTGVTRTASFQKKRESQKRRSMDILNESEQNKTEGQVRYPTGTSTGTLSDLKKQRAEQHKLGNGLDAQVQNLFLNSLSGDSRKYSSSGLHTQQQANKENTQNGKNVRNNNNMSGQSRPPTFFSDNGPLRRFSAPNSAPVIGDDDKFKHDCCAIL